MQVLLLTCDVRKEGTEGRWEGRMEGRTEGRTEGWKRKKAGKEEGCKDARKAEIARDNQR